MGTYTVTADADYRNEGWTLTGTGVGDLTDAWDNDDDGNYASCPSNRGRAAVRFPVDISSSDIPDGAAITSVTVSIRVRRTTEVGKSITVNVLSTEDTSRYTSRTLYPTQSFATYEVGTYTVDALGKPWTKDRLNRMALQVFSYSVPPNDGVRVAKVYATVNYKERPTVAVTAPTGTVNSPSPQLTWTYTQSDGDLQKSAEYKIFTAAQVGVTEFSADTATPVYTNTVTGDITTLKLPTALSPDNYYIYVRATSVFDSVSAWNSRAFALTGAAPGVPGGGVGGIGFGGGGGFERVIADPVTSNAYLTLRDGSNLLSVQQASFETDVDSLGYTGDNATLAYDPTTFYQGTGSMKLTATALGDAKATSSYLEVAPSTDVTAVVQTRAAVTGRTTWLFILFYDDEFTYLPAYTISASAANSDTTWTEITCTGETPPSEDTVIYAQVQVMFEDAAASEVHNIDQVGLMYGANSIWSHGGHMSRNILSSAASDADEPVTDEPWEATSASTVTRETATGIGAEGSKMFQMVYDGTAPSISFVAAGTADSQTTDGTGFTLNKPAGVLDGDVLVAYITADVTNSNPLDIPTGWTQVNTVTAGSGLTRTSMWILMRDGETADPATWVGNTATTATRRRAIVVAYRGAASTATQFDVENATSSVAGALTTQGPTLSNTDANAWRLGAFALRDTTATAGSSVANLSPPSSVPPIAYVGRSANWWYGGAQSTYQVNKPSGTVEGDFMLAFGSYSGTATPTAPTGWTQVRRTVKSVNGGDDHSGSVTFVVWKKVAGASEPSSWTASYTGTGTPLMTQAVAYRYCDDLIDESAATSTSDGVATGEVTNTDSSAWRVSAFTFTTPFGDRTSSNEVTERADYKTDVGAHPDVQIGVYDSNGPVSTGDHEKDGWTSSTYDVWAAVGWIGLLKPVTAISPGANETERADGGAFAATYGLHLSAYDGNTVAATGSQTLYGTYTPSSGTDIISSCAWMGFLVPAAPVTAGEVGANLVEEVDISAVSTEVIDRAGGFVTYQAAFLGSTGGTPYLKLYFYSGNELIATRIAEGSSFNTTTWVKSVHSFEIPAGTTRIGCGVTASDREIADEVYFDRVSVAFGVGTVWRRGTGRAEHPIFNVPVIEYAEDTGAGYGDWAVLGGTEAALLKYDQLTGLVTYVDQMLTPLASRKYRAKTISHGLEGDVFASNFGAESDEISLIADEWWIKDPSDPDAALQIKVKSEALGVTTASTAAVFQPLGADRPVVLTEGYKGDTFTITVICDRLQYAAIRQLLNARKTLFLQSNLDNAWWVRPIGDIGSDTQETGKRHEDPLRFVKLTFTEVDPE